MSYTLSDALGDFLLSLRGGSVSSETRKIHDLNLSKMVAYLGGDIPLLSVSLKDLQRWQASEYERVEAGDISAWTVHQMTRSCRRFFNWCLQRKVIRWSPARHLELPQLPQDRPPKNISDVDAARMLAEAKRSHVQCYAAVRFLLATGCRSSGLRQLTVNAVELNERRAWVSEKGGKGRYVYFDDNTAETLRAYLVWRGTLDHNVFFVTQGKRTPFRRYTLHQMLKRLGRRAGCEGPHNAHSFRHAFARRLADSDADISEISALLGHSSTQVTEQFYAPWTDSRRKRAYERYDPMRKFSKKSQ